MLDTSKLKRHTNLPPLESEGESNHNGNAEGVDKSPPEIADGPLPVEGVQRYRLNEDGWRIEEDYDSTQKGTVPYDVIFDGSRYWHLKDEMWYDLNKEDTKLELVKEYELDKTRLDDKNNELDSAVQFINRHNRVVAAYAISGYSAGLYCIAPGQMILVPTGFTPIKADSEGGCDGLLKLLRQIFPLDIEGKDQLQYALAMWKTRRQALVQRSFPPAQVQVLIGPKNCGKTLLQEQILTPLFGGREAEPFPYLCGLTRFNDDLFAAEHLKMSDEIGTSDPDKRRQFGTKLKALIFNSSKRVEGKNNTPTTIKPAPGFVRSPQMTNQRI
jgi:hypothetical protein